MVLSLPPFRKKGPSPEVAKKFLTDDVYGILYLNVEDDVQRPNPTVFWEKGEFFVIWKGFVVSGNPSTAGYELNLTADAGNAIAGWGGNPSEIRKKIFNLVEEDYHILDKCKTGEAIPWIKFDVC